MANIPSRDEILKFVSTQTGKIGKREIARAFNIRGSDRIPLKALLREMTAEGLLEKTDRSKALRKAGELPAVAVLKISGRDEDGGFLATPTKDFGAKHIISVNEGGGRGKVNRRHKQVQMGDTILARLTRVGENIYTANIIRKLEQTTNAPIIGVLEDRGAELVLTPATRKDRRDYIIKDGASELTAGQLVKAERLPSKGRYGDNTARVLEIIGDVADPHAFSHLSLAENEIIEAFPDDALAEVENITPLAPQSQTDPLLALPFVTIDPADARDHDDAVYAEATPQGFSVWVAIADVAAYVAPNSPLDNSARARGNSVYLPDRVVAMLPERLSADLCSLRENETRPCLAVKMQIDKSGKITSHEFMRGFMQSRAKLTYTQAQAIFNGEGHEMAEVLRPLWHAYQALAAARDKRRPLDLDVPERRIVLNADGAISDIHIPPRLEAHRLIEEMMIAANVCAAKTLDKHRATFIYRVHDNPSRDKVETLNDFLRSLKLRLDLGQPLAPALFNGVMSQARNTPHYESVSEAILRAQMQAIYTPDNCGHFGLNLTHYTHFTSPIRRYADVLVHRALIACLQLGENGDQPEAARLAEIAEHISAAERRAVAAERAANDRYLAAFMSDSVGQDFTARVSGISRAGLFVRLPDTGADGIIPMSYLGDEHFFADPSGLQLKGKHSGKRYRLGDKIDVTLLEATPIKGGLLFAPKNTKQAGKKNANRNKRNRRAKKN